MELERITNKEILMNNSTDEQLVIQLIKGQASAFELLYFRYEKKIMGYTYSKIKNLEASEEVFQGIWEKVYKSIHKFDSSLKFSSWLFTISSNSINDYFRKNSKVMLELDKVPYEAHKDTNVDPLEAIDINDLKSPYKEVLNYKYIEGLTTKEISAKMSLSDSNVRKILSRGRNILRSKLEEDKNEL